MVEFMLAAILSYGIGISCFLLARCIIPNINIFCNIDGLFTQRFIGFERASRTEFGYSDSFPVLVHLDGVRNYYPGRILLRNSRITVLPDSYSNDFIYP
jgi:hypothetical protein